MRDNNKRKIKRFLSYCITLALLFPILLVDSDEVRAEESTVIGRALNYAIKIAEDDSHGYSWDGRLGQDFDCSSLVIRAFKDAGLSLLGATNTRDMKKTFTQEGFVWIPKSQIDLSNSSELRVGDVLLNEACHTEIYIGNGKNVGAHRGYESQWCVHSNIDNKFHRHGHYNLGEEPGDQDGGEISISNYYVYENGGWDGVLRYTGETPPPILPGELDTSKKFPVTVTANETISTYDNYGNVETGRRIDPGDICNIHEVYTNGYVKLDYPIPGGRRTTFAKSSDFDIPNNTAPILPGILDTSKKFPVTVTANKTISTYDSYGNVETGRRIDPGDICNIHEVYTNGFVKLDYPIPGDRRTAFAKSSDFDIPVADTSHNAEGCVDSVNPLPNAIQLAGWAFDRDNTNENIQVHVYIGDEGHAIVANKERTDVNDAFGVGNYHGFRDIITTSKTGRQLVSIHAINIGGGNNKLLWSQECDIPKDVEAPKVTNTYISEITRDSFRVCADVIDNVGVKSVRIATWTKSDPSDLIWRDAIHNGSGTYYVDVPRAEHSQQLNSFYINHIYAYDVADNYVSVGQNKDYSIISDTGKNIPEGEYRIIPKVDETMSLNCGDTGDQLNNVNIYDCVNDNNNQIFDIKYIDNGFYKIVKHGTDLVLDVWGDTYQLGTNVAIHAYNAGGNQQWMIRKADDRYYSIVSKSSGMALDVHKGYTENNTNVEAYADVKSENQKWLLKRLLRSEMVSCDFAKVTEDDYIEKANDIIVTVDGKRLIKDTDYTVNYKVANGNVTYVVTGINDYCENIEKTFAIEKGHIHIWNTATISFAENGKTAKAKRVCKGDSSHTEEVDAKVTSEVLSSATCVEKGNTRYTATATFSDGTKVSETKNVKNIEAKGHNWSEGVITFSVDGKTAKAKRICKNDAGHVEEVVAKVTSEVLSSATCVEKGTTRYTATATFSDGTKVSETKNVKDIAAKGHNWSEGVIKFSVDGKNAKAKRVCKNDGGHVEEVVAKVTSEVEIEATSEEKGTTKYTATATFSDGTKISGSKSIKDIPLKKNEWLEGVITFSEDGKTAKATRVSRDDDTLIEEVVAYVTSEIVMDATCTDMGTTRYTAVATFSDGTSVSATKNVDNIAEKGHIWKKAVFTFTDGGEKAVAVRVCKNKSTHVEKVTASVKKILESKSSLGKNGAIKYVATANFSDGTKTIEVKEKLIDKIGEIILLETSFTCDGDEHVPEVLVLDENGEEIDPENYEVIYPDDCVEAGEKEVLVSFYDDSYYWGEYNLTYKIKKASNKITAKSFKKTQSSNEQHFMIGAKALGGRIVYRSNNSKVRVASNGRVTIAANFAGSAAITITAGSDNYMTVKKTITITVEPTSSKIKSVVSKTKKKATVNWYRNKSVSGYQVQYSTTEDFSKGNKITNISGNNIVSVTLAKLTSGKTYYVRVRAYKKAGATKIIGGWSDVKKVIVK